MRVYARVCARACVCVCACARAFLQTKGMFDFGRASFSSMFDSDRASFFVHVPF